MKDGSTFIHSCAKGAHLNSRIISVSLFRWEILQAKKKQQQMKKQNKTKQKKTRFDLNLLP